MNGPSEGPEAPATVHLPPMQTQWSSPPPEQVQTPRQSHIWPPQPQIHNQSTFSGFSSPLQPPGHYRHDSPNTYPREYQPAPQYHPSIMHPHNGYQMLPAQTASQGPLYQQQLFHGPGGHVASQQKTVQLKSVPSLEVQPTVPSVVKQATKSDKKTDKKKKEPTTDPAADSSKKPKGGAGSRSGSKRRHSGASDEEIDLLEPAEKEAAELGIPKPSAKGSKEDDGEEDEDEKATGLYSEKIQKVIVDYIVAPERWEFSRLKQATMIDNLVGILMPLGVKTTRGQLQNWWQRQFRKYKATRRLIAGFTGGKGDASKEQIAEIVVTQTKANGGKKSKKEHGAEWSNDDLFMFSSHWMYDSIDNVAHNDPDVVRALTLDSARPIEERPTKKKKKKNAKRSDSDHDHSSSSSDTDKAKKSRKPVHGHAIERAVKLMAKRHELQHERDQRSLAIEERRAEREEADAKAARDATAQRLRIERERSEREDMDEYSRLKDSLDPVELARARILRARILAAAPQSP